MDRVKKVVLGMMMLGMAGIAFAQSPQEPLEEVITIETFFPAPWAEFDEMRLYPTTREAGYCDNDRIGYMYYDDNGTGATQNDDAVKVCKGTELGWQKLGGLWTASGNDIYNSNTGNVGIGTAGPPTEALEVAGGIKVGNTANTNAGTIRWSGTDFEGYDGSKWVSFTAIGSGGGGTAEADCNGAVGGIWNATQGVCFFAGTSCPAGWTSNGFSSTNGNTCGPIYDSSNCFPPPSPAKCVTGQHTRQSFPVETCNYNWSDSNCFPIYSGTCTADITETGCTK